MAFDEGKSGISFYIRKVVKYLSLTNKVDLLLLKKDVKVWKQKSDNIHIKTVSNLLSNPIVNMPWHLLLPLFINLKKYDFILLPAGNRRLFCFYPRYTVVTFHDLSQFHIKEKYDFFRMFYIKKIVPIFLRKADSIMTVSYSTKKDLKKNYGIEDTWVNHNGWESFADFGKTEIVKEVVGKFLLYVSRIEYPGKNHINLIKAYEKLPDIIKGEYQLVLAGKIWKGSKPVIDYIQNSADAKRIKLLGFVEEKKLVWLFKNCSLYIFPSFYEGFGLSLLDAMSFGVPVICSNTSSLPEVGGNAVRTFSPNDYEEMRDQILEVLTNKGLQKRMKEAGLQQVKKFDWKTHVQKILRDYEKNA